MTVRLKPNCSQSAGSVGSTSSSANAPLMICRASSSTTTAAKRAGRHGAPRSRDRVRLHTGRAKKLGHRKHHMSIRPRTPAPRASAATGRRGERDRRRAARPRRASPSRCRPASSSRAPRAPRRRRAPSRRRPARAGRRSSPEANESPPPTRSRISRASNDGPTWKPSRVRHTALQSLQSRRARPAQGRRDERELRLIVEHAAEQPLVAPDVELEEVLVRLLQGIPERRREVLLVAEAGRRRAARSRG